MFMTERKLTKTELKKNGLLKLIERWQQLCLDGYSFEYDRNIDCAIRLFKHVELSSDAEGNFDFYFNEFDWYYDHLDDKLPVLCILSAILSYNHESLCIRIAIDMYIEKTATVRQYENYRVLCYGISIIEEAKGESNLIHKYNDMAAKLKLDVIPEYGVDHSIAIDAMEDLFNLLQKARKDAVGEKLRELSPHLNLTFTGPIHNSGTLTGSVINPQYNK